MALPLIWLPKVLKDAGLKVSEVPGWKTRGKNNVGPIKGVVCHHTVGRPTGNMPSLNLLITGTSNVPGPLSQLGLGRDGTFFVVAAGRANHAGKGKWQGIRSGNTNFIGIEGENTGLRTDFPWPEVQMDAYRRGVAAVLAHINARPIMCCGHKEYGLPAGRKIDPLFDMNVFRMNVGAIMDGTARPPILIPPEDSENRPTLRRGAEGKLVKEIQKGVDAKADGKFGPKTEAAVREFQRDHGLVPDGIVGPQTWAALSA